MIIFTEKSEKFYTVLFQSFLSTPVISCPDKILTKIINIHSCPLRELAPPNCPKRDHQATAVQLLLLVILLIAYSVVSSGLFLLYLLLLAMVLVLRELFAAIILLMFIALPLAPIGIFGMIFSPAVACFMTLGYSTLLFLYFLYNYFFGCSNDEDDECDPDCPGPD